MALRYDRHSSRMSLASTDNGSRRHSLLSADGNQHLDSTYNYADSWSPQGDKLRRWRQTYIASETGDTEGVQSTSLALPDDSRFTTCMALSDDQPLLAIGSGSYETNMFFVQSLDDQLDVKASFASKFPIYSLALKSNLLMAGTDRNTSVLYHVDRARLLGFASDDSDGPLVRCVGTFKNKAAKSIDVAAPGNHVPTKRVSCVEFAPPFAAGSSSGWPPAQVAAGADVFLACLGGVVNVWDASSSQHALRAEKVSAQPISRAAWSPQAPANLIAAGGTDGVVSIIDLRRRGRSLVWRTAGASVDAVGGYSSWLGGAGLAGDSGAVNDVAWSPFVPYWLAAGGESGAVSLWDLRYVSECGPAATLRHPTGHGAARSVAWSASHADMLSTGSGDKAWWLQSMRAEDFADGSGRRSVRAAVVAERRAADDIGSVIAVRAKGTTFYTLSSCGDLYAHRLTGQALQGAAVHRVGSEFAAAEEAVYARDVRKAAEIVLGMMEEGDLGDETETNKTLCDLFKVKPRPGHNSWALPPQSSGAAAGSSLADGVGSGGSGGLNQAVLNSGEAAAAFLADIERFGYGLPPDFPLEAVAQRHPVVLQVLERLNLASLRTKLADLVADPQATTSNGQPAWKVIVEKHKVIAQYAQKAPALFDAKLLRGVVKLVLPHDCIAGLSLGLGICRAFLANGRSEELDSLVHVLLFPTVFDVADDAAAAAAADSAGARPVLVLDAEQVRARIRECLVACPAAVLEMVALEISIQETVLAGGEQAQVAESIVAAMKAHAQTVAPMLAGSNMQIHTAYPATTTVSASVVRLYFNSLVPMRAYDEYLVNTQWWRAQSPPDSATEGRLVGADFGWPSSYPLARLLNRQAATLVVPRFRRQIDVVRSTVQKEPLSLEPRLYRDTLLKIARVNLLMRCDTALGFTASSPPGGQQMTSTSVSSSELSESFEEVGHAFLMLLEALTRHSSQREAYKKAAAEAQPLYESLSALLESERANRPHQRQMGRLGAAGGPKDIDLLLLDERKAHMSTVSRYLRKLEQYTGTTTTKTSTNERGL
ncbi:hypothetical protein BX661DRAFT_186393 [Kickxella alabastrina]|uniref:uncharacterized protein n=1 Tax=Kickxella alabastrina TaxID=61397 RepID=UPI00221E6E72|nr:uncharacterized protein BX661DRAFT_186393 [Kickxella alabastrina]KAI7823757.1 hypothetical protein BX661DRAFT_186393 [Kickxella alabastrina]